MNDFQQFEVKEESIDYLITKEDVILVYMKSGKCWVCDKKIGLKYSAMPDKTVLLTLASKKGKRDRYEK